MDIIDTIYNCGDSCIDMLSFSCSQNEICKGFSVFRNQSGKTFSRLTETINNNSYLIVKTEHMNTLLDNLSLTTPMPSTSMPSTSMPLLHANYHANYFYANYFYAFHLCRLLLCQLLLCRLLLCQLLLCRHFYANNNIK